MSEGEQPEAKQVKLPALWAGSFTCFDILIGYGNIKLEKRSSIAPRFSENHDARFPQGADVKPPRILGLVLGFCVSRHNKA